MELLSEFKLAPAMRGVFTFRAEDAEAARKELLDQDIESGVDVAATKERRARILAVCVPLERHMRSVVHYGIPLAELIAIAAAGHDGALVQALRIDPSILSLPALASRIARATIAGDQKFFRAVGNALKLETLSYEDVEHADLRFLLGILEPMHAIPHLGVNGTYKLLAEHLHVYTTEGSEAGREGDQARSLWQFITRWRKDVSTKKRRRM